MKLAVFGLSVSSSWGNGHATLWRGLIEALSADGHRVVFFERDVPYYAAHRDLTRLDPAELILYEHWREVLPLARREVAEADAAIVTSYCPDGQAAATLMLEAARPRKVFYDLDTPVTLARLRAGEDVEYLPRGGLGGMDLVLSYTGGRALETLTSVLGARRVAPLYGSVDPRAHHPAPGADHHRADLSYLGTYSADRQAALDLLLLGPARRRPERSFLVAGAQYPETIDWPENVRTSPHVVPDEHPSFYCSSPLTLSVTRAPMAELGYCPSGRLFEAAACGVPVLADHWEGLETFFAPEDEILIARTAEDVLAALDRPREELARIGRAARERALSEHTARRRAAELVRLLG